MRPEVVITDELSVNDCNAVQKVINAGIKVLASAHFCAMERVNREFLGVFERYILLSNRTVGKLERVYDEKGKEMVGYVH